MRSKNLIVILCLVFGVNSALLAQDAEYVGAAKCKICHNKAGTPAKPAVKQYDIWAASLHAKAMASLSNEKSKAYAQKNGIADPAKDAKCLKCHSTFWNVKESLRGTITEAEGVSCETCHGPGSLYKTNAFMKPEVAKTKGLIVPSEALCKKCHNAENPFSKPFNYEEAKKSISHMNPKAV